MTENKSFTNQFNINDHNIEPGDLLPIATYKPSNSTQDSCHVDTDEKLYLSALNSNCKVVLKRLSSKYELKEKHPVHSSNSINTKEKLNLHKKISKVDEIKTVDLDRLRLPSESKSVMSVKPSDLIKREISVSVTSDETSDSDFEESRLYIVTDYSEKKELQNTKSKYGFKSKNHESKLHETINGATWSQHRSSKAQRTKTKDKLQKNVDWIDKNVKETPMTYEQLFKKNFSILGSGLKIAKKSVPKQENIGKAEIGEPEHSKEDLNNSNGNVVIVNKVNNDGKVMENNDNKSGRTNDCSVNDNQEISNKKSINTKNIEPVEKVNQVLEMNQIEKLHEKDDLEDNERKNSGDEQFGEDKTNLNQTGLGSSKTGKVFQDPWKKYFARKDFNHLDEEENVFKKRKLNDVIEIGDSDDSNSIEVIVNEESLDTPVQWSTNRDPWILHSEHYRFIDKSVMNNPRDAKWLSLRNRYVSSRYVEDSDNDFCEIIQQNEVEDEFKHHRSFDIELSSDDCAQDINRTAELSSDFSDRNECRTRNLWFESLHNKNKKPFRNQFQSQLSPPYSILSPSSPHQEYLESFSRSEYDERCFGNSSFKTSEKPKFILPFQYKYVKLGHTSGSVRDSPPLNAYNGENSRINHRLCEDEDDNKDVGPREIENHCRGCRCHNSININNYDRYIQDRELFMHENSYRASHDSYAQNRNNFTPSWNDISNGTFPLPVLRDPFDDERPRPRRGRSKPECF